MKLRVTIWNGIWRLCRGLYGSAAMPMPHALFFHGLGRRVAGVPSPLFPARKKHLLDPGRIRNVHARTALAGQTLTSHGMDVAAMNIVLDVLARQAVRRILEFGSGVSTVALAAAVRGGSSGAAPGAGPSVVSIEENPEYAARTAAWLAPRQLDGTARVLCCPLVARRIAGQEVRAYEWSLSRFRDAVGDWAPDLVFVDGPSTGRAARAAAIADGASLAAPGCPILMDDALRAQELDVIGIVQRLGIAAFRGVVPVGKGIAVGRYTAGPETAQGAAA